MRLDELELGKTATIQKVGGKGTVRQRLLDLGVIPGAKITFVKYAPMGDPLEFTIHGYELTLRKDDASRIELDPKSVVVLDPDRRRHVSVEEAAVYSDEEVEHIGLGQEGRYHTGASAHPLPEGTTVTFALAGNQNCGKTTLFNQLTGSNQHVGNFPGVTVDRKDGVIRGHPDTLITDLPGIYSLSPFSGEEIVSLDFLLDAKPKGIINVVDATVIDRNLYLTTQLLELGIPMVLALNMMDEMSANGGSVRINEMERELGIAVVPISAALNQGVDELAEHAVHVARNQEFKGTQVFADEENPVEHALHIISELIDERCIEKGVPIRTAATKVVEGDKRMLKRLNLDEEIAEAVEHVVADMEKECGLDRSAAIADMRFTYIEGVVERCVVKPRQSKQSMRSSSIDRILTGKWTALPAFFLIMAAIFALTFNLVGPFLQDLMQQGVDTFSTTTAARLEAAGTSEIVRSLVVDGIINGVGTVISFLPIIALFFLFLSMLEDTGYMARIAFVTDGFLRRVGLSGRSIVPLLVGLGCTVPAVMSTRTLSSEHDRKLAVILAPFSGCTPKLTIMAFVASTFFPGHSALILGIMFICSVAIGILTMGIARRTFVKGEPIPLMMELPNYRFPAPKTVAHLVWDKSKDFLQKSFTVIFAATVIVWIMQTFNPAFAVVTDPADSILAGISTALEPIFAPLGLGDWRLITPLLVGVAAKETVVSTLVVLMGGVGSLLSGINIVQALTLMTFIMLYTPCIAAIDAVRRELGLRWAIGVFCTQWAIAWIVSFAVYNLGSALFL